MSNLSFRNILHTGWRGLLEVTVPAAICKISGLELSCYGPKEQGEGRFASRGECMPIDRGAGDHWTTSCSNVHSTHCTTTRWDKIG